MKELRKKALGLIFAGIFFGSFTISPRATQAQPNPYDSQPNNEIAMKLEGPIDCGSCPEKLGLTDEQMEKLIALDSDYEIKNAQKRAQLVSDIKQMALQMTEPKTDKAAVLALDEKINSLKTELAIARANKMLEGMSILTEKQKELMHHHMLVHMLSHPPMPAMSGKYPHHSEHEYHHQSEGQR